MLFLCLMLSLAGWANEGPVESVNINTADAETLSARLVGVGVSRAQSIIEYREANGGFVTVEELGNVRGIGPATLKRNLERISITDE